MNNVKSVPTGVKIISVLYYVGAVLGLIFGLIFILGGGMIGSMASSFQMLGALGAGLFIFGGLVLIGFAVLSFFIGRGLWKAKNWARIVAIIFAVLGVLMAVLSMAAGSFSGSIINLVLNFAIGGYLLLNKSVKQAFS